MPELLITPRESPDEVELVISGELTAEDLPALQKAMDEALRSGRGKIALNLEGMDRLGSAAIGKILHFKKRCDEAGRSLVIRRCGPQMLSLLKMVKFDALIPMEP
jgi:anti-anti-sigma factor